MRTRGFAFLLGLSLGALPTSARADDYPTCAGRTVTTADSEAAHIKYLAGKVDYDEYRFTAAIAQFRDAYARDCQKHELLIIIARAYELSGDVPSAIRALQTYLARAPNAPDAPTLRTRLENMKRAAPSEPAPAPAAAASPAAASSAPAPAAPRAEPSEAARSHTVLPWVVFGVGAAAVTAGAVLLVAAPAVPRGCDTATDFCAPLPRESASEYDERKRTAGLAEGLPLAGVITLASGVLVMGGGLLWHFLEPTGSSSGASAAIVPTAGRGYGGVALEGRF